MSFRVKRMREVHSAALKHGIAIADIRHALRHPMRVQEEDDRRRFYLGSSRNGELLEVVTALRPDQSEIVIHAMKMRMKYANLLPRE
jgi:uncharacterized DUF497 family protein